MWGECGVVCDYGECRRECGVCDYGGCVRVGECVNVSMSVCKRSTSV